MFKKVNEQLKPKTEATMSPSEEAEEDDNETSPPLILKVPFRGDKGERLIKNLRENLEKNLPKTLKYRIVNTGTKLSQHFNLKDPTDKKHLSNFIYRWNCTNKKCKDNYGGETSRRRVKRTSEHAGKDKNSHIFQHTSKTKHPRAKDEDFEILAVNYPNRRKRRLAEAMFIRDLKLTLNKQKESYKLNLFAWSRVISSVDQ